LSPPRPARKAGEQGPKAGLTPHGAPPCGCGRKEPPWLPPMAKTVSATSCALVPRLGLTWATRPSAAAAASRRRWVRPLERVEASTRRSSRWSRLPSSSVTLTSSGWALPWLVAASASSKVHVGAPGPIGASIGRFRVPCRPKPQRGLLADVVSLAAGWAIDFLAPSRRSAANLGRQANRMTTSRCSGRRDPRSSSRPARGGAHVRWLWCALQQETPGRRWSAGRLRTTTRATQPPSTAVREPLGVCVPPRPPATASTLGGVPVRPTRSSPGRRCG